MGIFPNNCFIDVPFLSDSEKESLLSGIMYEDSEDFQERNIKEIRRFLMKIPSTPLEVFSAAHRIKSNYGSLGKYLNNASSTAPEKMHPTIP